MEQLNNCCFNFAHFPSGSSLVYPDTYKFYLEKYRNHIQNDKTKLFCEEENATVDILQLEEKARAFSARLEVKNLESLNKTLRRHNTADPICQFIFIHAPHARAQLNTSLEMFLLTLTYFQTMPAFLDFVFPFGEQEYPTDFYFSGFRHIDRLSTPRKGLRVPQLGRSGRGFQLCYNLKSVEKSSDLKWPWSIRQTALYHSFDIENGRSNWIIVKGNKFMRNRIEQASKSTERGDLKDHSSVSKAFSASLAVHLILCDWAGENWRWFTNFLEQGLHGSTRHAMRSSLDRPYSAIPSSPMEAPDSPRLVSPRRQFTMPLPGKRTFSFQIEPFQKRDHTKGSRSIDNISLAKLDEAKGLRKAKVTEKPSGLEKSREPEKLEDLNVLKADDFSFNDLQTTESIEEKADETLLILKTNTTILKEIRNYYRQVVESEDCPDEVRIGCKDDLAHFERRISGIINSLDMQQSRLETLLRQLSSRKSLLFEKLNYQTTQVNKNLAEKAQTSADKMELLTGQMHEIAVKTENETIFMRIITLVTLFFLPGTFISTLMSTPIIQFPRNPDGAVEKQYTSAALVLFIELCIPFMVLTLGASIGFYVWEKKAEKAKRERKWDIEYGQAPVSCGL